MQGERDWFAKWILRGFQLDHTPGIARALVRHERSGDQFILTDAGGFDLPDQDGPFRILQLARDGQLLDGPETLMTAYQLAVWLRERSSLPLPTDPRM